MNIPDMNDQTDIRIRVDGIDQKRSIRKQVLIVGPVAEDGDRELLIVPTVVARTIIRNGGLIKKRCEQDG
jgi:hypothetical protein